jgi:hypothetical protein
MKASAWNRFELTEAYSVQIKLMLFQQFFFRGSFAFRRKLPKKLLKDDRIWLENKSACLPLSL